MSQIQTPLDKEPNGAVFTGNQLGLGHRLQRQVGSWLAKWVFKQEGKRRCANVLAGRECGWEAGPTGWCVFDSEERHFSEEVRHPIIRSQHWWKNEKLNIKAPIPHLFAALRCSLPTVSVHHPLGQGLAHRKETLFHNLPCDNIYMICTYFRKIFPDITLMINTHDHKHPWPYKNNKRIENLKAKRH